MLEWNWAILQAKKSVSIFFSFDSTWVQDGFQSQNITKKKKKKKWIVLILVKEYILCPFMK